MSQPHYDFKGFIYRNQELIFGTRHAVCMIRYKRNIAALDMKMNALLSEGGALKEDPRLLLGLFSLSIGQFGILAKTDVSRYKEEFYSFLAEGAS